MANSNFYLNYGAQKVSNVLKNCPITESNQHKKIAKTITLTKTETETKELWEAHN